VLNERETIWCLVMLNSHYLGVFVEIIFAHFVPFQGGLIMVEPITHLGLTDIIHHGILAAECTSAVISC
jgi:hypothetical protein